MKIYSCVEVKVKITDDIPLLNWILHFAMKMRVGRGWKKSVAQCGEKEPMWFMERIIQGVFVCHHDRKRTISNITKSGLVQGKSWTRQILSDDWESTNWEDLFDNPLHTVIAETRLTEKFVEDEKGTDLFLPGNLVKKPLEVKHRKLYIVYEGTEADGHIGSCPGYALLTLLGKATKPRKDEFRERVGTIIERTLAGEARIGNVQGQNR